MKTKQLAKSDDLCFECACIMVKGDPVYPIANIPAAICEECYRDTIVL